MNFIRNFEAIWVLRHRFKVLYNGVKVIGNLSFPLGLKCTVMSWYLVLEVYYWIHVKIIYN